MTASPALPYHCPVLRIDFLQRPCEKNLKRAEVLKKNWYNAGGLEQCQECRGARLEVKDLEASKELNVFCPAHPEQRLDVVKNQKKGGMRAIMTKCALCEAAAKAPAVQAVGYCKNHPEKAAVIDRLNRNMGLCLECLQERGRVAGTKVAQTGSSGPPIAIPLRQPKYIELKAWLEEQAEEYERTLTEEIMYRLKLAMRQAEKI